MVLAAMTAADEDALVCDFAETYHVYNYRGLPLRYAAVLACGLRDNSRIKMKMTKAQVSTDTMLSAVIADAVNLLVWMQTKDGRKNRNRPKSLVDIMTNPQREKSRVMTFETPEAYERYRRALIGDA